MSLEKAKESLAQIRFEERVRERAPDLWAEIMMPEFR